MNKIDIRARLDSELSALSWTERDTRTALRTMKGEIKVKKRMTFALSLTLALILLTATALGVSGAIEKWLGSVERMLNERIFTEWNIESKTRFVTAMHDAGLDMDESDYALLTDQTQPESVREAAADRVIDARYGEMMREDASHWIDVPETVVGMAPDEHIIFREAFFAAFPDATEREYEDAYYFWRRDRNRRDTQAPAPTPEPPVVNAQYTHDTVRSFMTEVLNWGTETAEKAEIEVSYNEEYDMWEGVGRADKALVESGEEPTTQAPYVLDLGDQYEIRIVITKDRRIESNITPADLAARLAAQTPPPIGEDDPDVYVPAAARKVMEVYHLTQAQVDQFVTVTGDRYRRRDNHALQTVLFRPTAYGMNLGDWLYAVIVDLATNEAVDWLTPEDRFSEERLQKLADAYLAMPEDERLYFARWYGTFDADNGFTDWSVEKKARFCGIMKPVGDALVAADPDYGDPRKFYDPFVIATRRVYGVPGENDLSQDQALTLARRAGEQALSLNEGALDDWTPSVSFDVTDQERPVWRFILANHNENRDYKLPWLCVVYLNARTGDILDSFDPNARGGWTYTVQLL